MSRVIYLGVTVYVLMASLFAYSAQILKAPIDQDAWFDTAYLHCLSDQIEIGVYANSIHEDNYVREPKVSGQYKYLIMAEAVLIDRSVKLDRKNRVKIRIGDGAYQFVDNVLVATDGAGNHQILTVNGDPGQLEVDGLSIFFDHEENNANGYFTHPKTHRLIDISAACKTAV